METKIINRTKSSYSDDYKNAILFEMTPIITYNKETGNYFAYYKEFPRASAVAKTEKEVIIDLQEIFKVMLKEHNQEITEEALRIISTR